MTLWARADAQQQMSAHSKSPSLNDMFLIIIGLSWVVNYIIRSGGAGP
jgi:hypothetical protein